MGAGARRQHPVLDQEQGDLIPFLDQIHREIILPRHHVVVERIARLDEQILGHPCLLSLRKNLSRRNGENKSILLGWGEENRVLRRIGNKQILASTVAAGQPLAAAASLELV